MEKEYQDIFNEIQDTFGKSKLQPSQYSALALAYIGEETIVSRDPEVLLKADKAILPGVGSFGQAMENLHRYNLVPVIKDMVKNNTPFLGICLGLQLLFESSEETPGVEGIGILKGKILRIPPAEGCLLYTSPSPRDS